MSEEKARGFRVATSIFDWGIGWLILIVSIVAVAIVAVAMAVYWVGTSIFPESDLTQTKTLTILHAWEEGGQYYFADELGSVYLIGCGENLWKEEGEIRYDDMPKIRFDKLEEGQRYNVEYVIRQGNVRLSLGEEEMVR